MRSGWMHNTAKPFVSCRETSLAVSKAPIFVQGLSNSVELPEMRWRTTRASLSAITDGERVFATWN